MEFLTTENTENTEERFVMQSESKKVLYLAGAITGVPDARERFAVAGASLRAAGYVTINPCAAFSAGMSWEWYMARCVPLLLGADGVALIDGWQDSRGARVEASTAEGCGTPVASVSTWLVRAGFGGE